MAVAPNPTIDLITPADGKAWMTALNLTVLPDDELQQIITGVSAAIQRWLGWYAITQSFTDTFDGAGQRRIALRGKPITAVQSLVIDGLTIPQATDTIRPGYAFSGYWLSIRDGRFTRGIQNVSISYTAGLPVAQIDPALAQACRDAMTAITQLAPRELGLLVEKIGGLEERFSPASDFDAARLNTFVLTPAITLALTPMRRVAPVG